MQSLLRVATLALAAAGADAATLNVSITDKDGQPVADTAVLLRYAITPSVQPPRPASVTIAQEKLRYLPYLSIVAPGTMLSFNNRDGFDHHIRGTAPLVGGAPGKDFEARLGPDAGKPFETRVTDLGRYELGCHLHSRMRGYVLVTELPWFGQTDANGRLTLTGLPEGAADVQVLHPEQFVDQTSQRATFGATPVALSFTLNFAPRHRRAP